LEKYERTGEDHRMIKLTRLNGDEFVVNAELIRIVESRPDTYVTLTSSDRLIVRESVEEVVQRSIAYSQVVRALPPAGF
jgi:flagellar protein FlbD